MSGWLKLKLTLKEDFCDISVTAFSANFFMHSPKRYFDEHIQSFSVPNAPSESKICKRRALASLLCGSPSGEANHHLFHLIFRKVNDYRLLRVLALLHPVQASMDARFHGEK